VRSPHNIVVTIFARSGVLGLGLWLAMLGTVGWWIMSAVQVCRRLGDRGNELFGVWMGAALLAIVIVSSFGVVLEGPIGGIPFFVLLGLSMAWADQQRRRRNT
jgi:O-antigen ligase